MQKRGRVTLLVTLSIVVLLVLLSGVGSGQSRPPRTVTVGIGVHEQSTFQQAVQYYNEKHRIIEKTAKELFNIDLKLKWYTFPFAPQHIAAMQAGDVQIGSFATFPIITQIKKRGVTLAPLTESLGAYEFLLMVKKDGPIKTFEDLKGKNVAVPVGTSPHGAFELFVLTEFGKTPRELGINIVNQPWHAAYMPPGIDAFITYYPAATIFLGTEIVPLVSMLGYTGEAYDGPLGKGAGHRIPSVKNSPFYPEGYIALRNWFMAANGYEKKEPEVCIAFMVGHQKIIQALAKMTPHEITEYYPADEWKTTPRKAYEELALARDLAEVSQISV
ncbi:MAG: PhnD/SsuA/transferrin family substrate-binding protein [Bacillota bacterium]